MDVPVGVKTAKAFCGLFIIIAVLFSTRYDVLSWISFSSEEAPVAEAPRKPVKRNFREGRPAEDGGGGGLQAYMPGAKKDEAEAPPSPKLGKAAPRAPKPKEPEPEPEYDAFAVLLRAIGVAN